MLHLSHSVNLIESAFLNALASSPTKLSS